MKAKCEWKSDAERELLGSLGEALMYGHIIEDLIRLHLCELAFFGRLGNPRITEEDIKKCRLEEMIDLLPPSISPNPSFLKGLHTIRKLRNQVVHSLIEQVGEDLRTLEGCDQICALLAEITLWERKYLNRLKTAHESMLRSVLVEQTQRVLERQIQPCDRSVTASQMTKTLRQLQRLREP
jgi:hypothetical protein